MPEESIWKQPISEYARGVVEKGGSSGPQAQKTQITQNAGRGFNTMDTVPLGYGAPPPSHSTIPLGPNIENIPTFAPQNSATTSHIPSVMHELPPLVGPGDVPDAEVYTAQPAIPIDGNGSQRDNYPLNGREERQHGFIDTVLQTLPNFPNEE